MIYEDIQHALLARVIEGISVEMGGGEGVDFITFHMEDEDITLSSPSYDTRLTTVTGELEDLLNTPVIDVYEAVERWGDYQRSYHVVTELGEVSFFWESLEKRLVDVEIVSC